MDHLATVDTAFAALDDDHSALNIASVGVFAGPVLDSRDFVALFRRKLHLVPRLRQVLRPVPFGLARAVWVDDPEFDLCRHLRLTTVAAPGPMSDLEQLVGDFVSVPLAPDRPLWQALLVDGLPDRRWAIVIKLHHSVLDGMGGAAIMGRLLDTSADAALPAPSTWHAEPTPGRVSLLRSAARFQAHTARSAVGGMVRMSVRPRRAVHDVRALAAGLTAFRPGLRHGVPSSLSGPVGTSRTYLLGQIALNELHAIRASLGGSVNDVVLALVTGAERSMIVARGQRVRAHEVHCLVPVSPRSDGPADSAGTRVSALVVDLPVESGQPAVRYEAVLARAKRAKRGYEADAGAGLQTALNALPSPVASAVVRAAAGVPPHSLTTVVANVPAGFRRLFALGRPLVEHYPYVPIADRVRTSIAVTSYEGRLFYGITAAHDSMHDATAFRDAIEREVETLSELARARRTDE
jgi:diacylglycerol O-acyltransferase / wax synthase